MEAQEKTTMDRLPLGIIVIDPKGNIEFINSDLSERMGVEKESITSSLLYDILEPSCIPDVLSFIRSGKSGPRELNLILDPPSGSLLNGLFLVKEHTLGDKKGFLFVLKELNVGTTKNEIGFQALEGLPIPITILNRDLKPLFQNSSVDEWIILPSKGKDPISSPGKEIRGKLFECLTTGRTVSFNIQVRTSEEPIEFEVIAHPLPSREGPEQVMEIWIPRSTDVDRKREGQDNGIEQEIIETANAIVIGLDLEGKVVLFNNGASRVLGYTFEEVRGTSWFDYLMDREVQAGRMEVLKWSIGSGFRTQYETKVRSGTGAPVIVSLENSVIFDRSGNVGMVLMIGQDITRMKELEDSLREQSEKLLSAMDEVTLYYDLMIHDIHNVNAGIMGYLELLNIEGISREKRNRYISSALGEVNRSSSIIKDVKLMSLARPATDKRPLNLRDVFENASRKCLEEWGAGLPVIERDVHELQVLSDDLFVEAMLRVLLNSVNRGREKGEKVIVTAKRDPAMSNKVPEPVHIVIRDGMGNVGEEELKRILDRPRSTDKGSRGLGLYLVKKIIDRYEGMIWVENTVEEPPGIAVHILLSEAV
ncbi:MAG: PAS domain S-box protein [Candidatus Thermoplasmatota archaeon]|nr:PAS domain S-box protein [Candidatus Thermoplasmatota archaeon]